jgi:hypothetical protein
MTRRAPARILLWTGVVVALLVGLHLLLLHLMAESAAAATLLSAGAHTPLGALLLAGSFVLVRLAAVLVLPGFVLYRLAQALFAWLAARQRKA